MTGPGPNPPGGGISEAGGARRRSIGRIVEIEMYWGAIRPPDGTGYELVYALLRWKGRPVGRLILEGARALPADAFRAAALEAAAPGILAAELDEVGPGHVFARLRSHSVGTPLDPAAISVVVATRDRPQDLTACLDALARLDPAPGEVIVVDSASKRGDEVAAAAASADARFLRLETPGLSRARNAGARAARGKAIAFLDDDCVADPGWLRALGRGFSDRGVTAVTGQLLPSEIETQAQRDFLRYSHMDLRGFVPRRFDASIPVSAYWPIDTWRMGSGGNLAVRAEPFRRLGGFSRALGLGTPARGGEDLYLLYSIIRGGGAVVYRPDAMAWHRHHRDDRSLARVLFGYGAGHSAYLRAARAAGAPRAALARYRLSYRADRALRLARSLFGFSRFPARLILREIAGSFAGGALGARAEARALAEAEGETEPAGIPAWALPDLTLDPSDEPTTDPGSRWPRSEPSTDPGSRPRSEEPDSDPGGLSSIDPAHPPRRPDRGDRDR